MASERAGTPRDAATPMGVRVTTFVRMQSIEALTRGASATGRLASTLWQGGS
ncbi:hypothetical protein LILAB_23395 [Corallococcus macrosporus]|uniref:Uncharacterized protein n=1 Tax=Myxococcus fulvus (strain ATCC BAA-855 / HW-1) TaxID=483219 RepID=F8CMV2_MYXFH|nr:hypothetical protein LILAB_23395 [Corallococcus macrosporus]